MTLAGTLAVAICWTAVRALVCSCVTVAFAEAVQRLVRQNFFVWRMVPRRACALAALVALLLTPDLLVGYAYADTWLSLVQFPVWNELLYGVLLSAKLTPVAVVLLWGAPANPLSSTARHCLRFLDRDRSRRTGATERALVWLRGPLKRFGPTGLLVFLLAFQDFELAARMVVVSWTVRLFDLHVREGMQLSESLVLVVWPLICELLVIATALWGLSRGRSLTGTATAPRPLSRWAARSTGVFLGLAVVLVTVVPCVVVMQETIPGLAGLMTKRWLLAREIGTGVGVALFAAVLAWTLSGLSGFRTGRLPLVLLVPGLLGPLVLSLAGRRGALAFDFQLAAWQPELAGRGLLASPVPLIVVLSLFLAPRAWLMRWLLDSARPRAPGHLAELLGKAGDGQRSAAASLQWDLTRRFRFWSVAVLAHWGFWDLTVLSILAPTGFVSTPVSLYNFMHYHHYPFISAMLCIAVVVPLVLAVIASAIARRMCLMSK